MLLSIEELIALVGRKEIEIFALQKQVAEMQKRIDELTKPNEPA